MNMNNTIEHSAEVNESEVSAVAYQKWEKAGHPSGQDLQFWLEAEAQLRAPAMATGTIVTAHLPPMAPGNSTHKGGNVPFGPSQPYSRKPGQKFRRP